jgi:hypothetical protein
MSALCSYFTVRATEAQTLQAAPGPFAYYSEEHWQPKNSWSSRSTGCTSAINWCWSPPSALMEKGTQTPDNGHSAGKRALSGRDKMPYRRCWLSRRSMRVTYRRPRLRRAVVRSPAESPRKFWWGFFQCFRPAVAHARRCAGRAARLAARLAAADSAPQSPDRLRAEPNSTADRSNRVSTASGALVT